MFLGGRWVEGGRGGGEAGEVGWDFGLRGREKGVGQFWMWTGGGSWQGGEGRIVVFGGLEGLRCLVKNMW